MQPWKHLMRTGVYANDQGRSVPLPVKVLAQMNFGGYPVYQALGEE